MWKHLLEQAQFETTQNIEPFAFWNKNYINMQIMWKVVREDAQIEKPKKQNHDAVWNRNYIKMQRMWKDIREDDEQLEKHKRWNNLSVMIAGFSSFESVKQAHRDSCDP